MERDDRYKKDSRNINRADSDMENTLSRYDEKMTKNIIMEFLKKSNLDDEKEETEYSDDGKYENRAGFQSEYDEEEEDSFEDEQEYEVYSNESLGFNDDYIPQYAAPGEADSFYEEEDDDDFDIETISNEKEKARNKSSYNSYDDIDLSSDNYKSGRRKRSTKEHDRKIKPARNGRENIKKRDDVRDYYERPLRSNKEREEDEYKEYKENGGVMAIVGKIAVVMVILLVVIVIILYNKLNDVNEEISDLSENANKAAEYEAKINELQSQISDLNLQIEEYEKAEAEKQSEQETESGAEGVEETAEEGGEAQQSSGPQQYTVVKGDSLSKISRKTYGSESYVEEIKEANNLTSDVLEIGQKLTLPEV